jgi:hypothetical protein
MITSIDASSTEYIENLMAKLCEKIRQGNRHTLYGELIADSIESAIRACFPLLRKTVGDPQILSWVGDFLRLHHCIEPQFFHIATEFVRFANTSLKQSQVQRSLMEYEWLLLATEVDNVFVPASERKISANALWQAEAYLTINPTLAEVSLPFDIEKVSTGSTKCDGARTYAVYRSSKHRVYSQKLSSFDHQLLALIRKTHTVKHELITQAIHHEVPAPFIERWLSHFCETDAVIFIKKK